MKNSTDENKCEIDFDISDQNILDLMNPNWGATIVKLEHFPLTLIVQQVLALSLSFTKPPKSNLISNYSFKCLPVDVESVWTKTAKEIEWILNERLMDKLFLEKIYFDDLYLTAYHPTSPGSLGVGPHLDTNCKGIVATIMLIGSLPFYLCKEKNLSGSSRIQVGQGEMLLMRAKHFYDLPRPLHYVGKIKNSTVIQFGLRQYINPNFKKD